MEARGLSPFFGCPEEETRRQKTCKMKKAALSAIPAHWGQATAEARMLYAGTFSSPLGELTLVCHAEAVVGLWLERHKYLAATAGCTIVEDRPDAPLLKLGRAWLAAYFSGRRPAVGDLPLAPEGTTFRKLVWKLLCAIPYGECVTYGDLARQAASALHKERMSARAVGGAVGHNPISIIIPCHRVVGVGGNLTGYGGGIARKIRLLELEGADMRHFALPRGGRYAVR